MKSSSIPPAVVTSAETCLCFTRCKITSRSPDEIRLEVYPRNTLHFVLALTSESLSSSGSASVQGSSERRHLICGKKRAVNANSYLQKIAHHFIDDVDRFS